MFYKSAINGVNATRVLFDSVSMSYKSAFDGVRRYKSTVSMSYTSAFDCVRRYKSTAWSSCDLYASTSTTSH